MILVKQLIHAAIACSLLLVGGVASAEVIQIAHADGDMTPVVRKAIENASDGDIELVFEKGVYAFSPDYAFQKHCDITNHGNGVKNIVFPFQNLNSVSVQGNGSEFVFHGQVLPFLFENCSQVSVNGLTIDWDIPFTFLAEVIAVNEEEEWRDVKPRTEGFSWSVHKGRLSFPNIDGFSYQKPGSTLAFDAQHKRVVHGALDVESDPKWVEERPGGILRFHEALRQFPEVGTLLCSKGDREHDRYAPAFHVKFSKDIHLENVIVHHALGMGFLMERTENATLKNCGVHLREGSNRVISSTADATHFCNCRGDILVEGCRIENMLDDGTNVHGTYVEVDRVIDERTVIVGLKHFEQSGFVFAGAGDAIWFIKQPDPSRIAENEVAVVDVINGRFIQLQFKHPLPDGLAKGDVLENKTWNPNFTMRGCTVRNHRARNIVLKTPRKIVIEDNDFSSMMSSIFFRGETFFWFESGAVEDVLIRNNRFNYCAYSGMEHAVLYITPRLGKDFDQIQRYDRNIRFEDNTIETFDSRIVWADRVDGLMITGNKIKRTGDAEPLHPDAALFDFKNCRNVTIADNQYEGTFAKAVEADEATRKTLKVEHNTGL